MRYLIDTNIFLFAILEPDCIDKNVKQIITDYNNRIYLSSISIQEIIHLHQYNKIRTKWKNTSDVFSTIKQLDIDIVHVKNEHLHTYSQLSLIDGHNDPNDRIIISQAITEKLTLISSDRKFNHYTKQKLAFVFNKK